jgi:hypothetical protein
LKCLTDSVGKIDGPTWVAFVSTGDVYGTHHDFKSGRFEVVGEDLSIGLGCENKQRKYHCYEVYHRFILV